MAVLKFTIRSFCTSKFTPDFSILAINFEASWTKKITTCGNENYKKLSKNKMQKILKVHEKLLKKLYYLFYKFCFKNISL